MKEVKCDCGHVNPFGTKICRKCGMVLGNEKENKLIDMRYEGSARRSQTYKKTIIDKIWNFFSSVKVGVTLIVIALIASAIGTILPRKCTSLQPRRLQSIMNWNMAGSEGCIMNSDFITCIVHGGI